MLYFTRTCCIIICVVVKNKERVFYVGNTERVSSFISPEVRAELEKMAKEKGLTLSAYIRSLLMEHVKEQKK